MFFTFSSAQQSEVRQAVLDTAVRVVVNRSIHLMRAWAEEEAERTFTSPVWRSTRVELARASMQKC